MIQVPFHFGSVAQTHEYVRKMEDVLKMEEVHKMQEKTQENKMQENKYIIPLPRHPLKKGVQSR